MRDYQERVTTGQTHTQTDGQADAGQSDPYVPLCFAGDTKSICSDRLHSAHLEASSCLMAQGVPTNNQKERRSEPYCF